MSSWTPGSQNRKGDNWHWLLRIAAEAGGEWPARALAAALYADDEATAADQNVVTALLAAIWDVFATKRCCPYRDPDADRRTAAG